MSTHPCQESSLRIRFLEAELAECRKHIRILSRQRDAICYRLETVWDIGPEVTGDIMSWEWVDQSEACCESLKAELASLTTENTALKKELEYTVSKKILEEARQDLVRSVLCSINAYVSQFQRRA